MAFGSARDFNFKELLYAYPASAVLVGFGILLATLPPALSTSKTKKLFYRLSITALYSTVASLMYGWLWALVMLQMPGQHLTIKNAEIVTSLWAATGATAGIVFNVIAVKRDRG